MPLLEISDLTVGLPRGGDRDLAVSRLDLTVGHGEIVCVVGESGSGKSVTAQAIMGLLPPELTVRSGAITFNGIDLLADSQAARRLRGDRIAMIFQEPSAALNPVFRIGDQVEEVLALHTRLDAAARRARMLDLLAEVHLPDPAGIARSYPHQLSGGQCQRVMIASALATEPALLIADEPTTALDVTTQAQILTLIRDLRQRHRAGILFITHDFGVVAEIADRILVMRRGLPVEQGPADQILRRPAQDYTRALLAAVPTLEPPAAPVRSAARAPLLEGRGLRKTYGRRAGLFARAVTFPALDDVSLTLDRGETLGVVGESGSGKSTLAQVLMRLVPLDGGEVLLDGTRFDRLPVRELRPARRRIQIVFQDPYSALDPRQTIGDAVAEGPVIHGLPRDQARRRAADLIQAVGLSEAALDRYPHQFSGGQRQRVCIARALALEPDILIADEAVSSLDVSVQAQILDLLESMQTRLGFGLLFITHDLRVAAQICDRIMVMRRGRVVESGPAARIFERPEQPYTRALLDAVPGRAWLAEKPALQATWS